MRLAWTPLDPTRRDLPPVPCGTGKRPRLPRELNSVSGWRVPAWRAVITLRADSIGPLNAESSATLIAPAAPRTTCPALTRITRPAATPIRNNSASASNQSSIDRFCSRTSEQHRVRFARALRRPLLPALLQPPETGPRSLHSQDATRSSPGWVHTCDSVGAAVLTDTFETEIRASRICSKDVSKRKLQPSAPHRIARLRRSVVSTKSARER